MRENVSPFNNKKENKKDEKIFKCSGCRELMSKYDEKCLNCERLNPDYIYK
ncbi:MAG: hypothetical protein V3V41_06750 [Candidatus Heimdallarchaeota archaeon]